MAGFVTDFRPSPQEDPFTSSCEGESHAYSDSHSHRRHGARGRDRRAATPPHGRLAEQGQHHGSGRRFVRAGIAAVRRLRAGPSDGRRHSARRPPASRVARLRIDSVFGEGMRRREEPELGAAGDRPRAAAGSQASSIDAWSCGSRTRTRGDARSPARSPPTTIRSRAAVRIPASPIRPRPSCLRPDLSIRAAKHVPQHPKQIQVADLQRRRPDRRSRRK